MNQIPALVLADIDVRTFFAVAVLVISFLGWIINVINGGQKKPNEARPARPEPRRPQPARDDRLNQEIDIFLQEVGGRRPAAQTPQAAPAPEPAPAAPRERTLVQQTRPAQAPTAPPPRPRDKPRRVVRSRPSNLDERRKVVAEELGERIRSHHVQTAIGHEATGNVAPLGTPLAATTPAAQGVELTPAAAAAASRPGDIAMLVRSPANVRQAILLSEILARPRALRR